ncbi:protein O-mannose kinase-like [Penaeus indicus]|uniref:protein O-mannose kinase-like n=1 Tax=Penaeus indicus TaxID=29960 RepID=UPI00300D00CE
MVLSCKLHFLVICSLILFELCICSKETCDSGFFRIGDMKECHPWITCRDIKDMAIGDLLGFGAVKQIYLSSWRNQAVAYVYINNRDYLEDFKAGLDFLKGIGPSRFIVQLIGFCEEAHVYITEYHPLGNAINVYKVFSEKNIGLKERFHLCIDYVSILEFLHNSPLGTVVMCDSNTLNKTLEQYLITSSLSLILNDVDALPQVGHEGIICGHREIRGDFVAPEQKWPYDGEEFTEGRMPRYSEKVDIWKIPAVCNHFLGKSEEARIFRYHVFSTHKQCREKRPQSRPSAREVLQLYEDLLEGYFSESIFSAKEEL